MSLENEKEYISCMGCRICIRLHRQMMKDSMSWSSGLVIHLCGECTETFEEFRRYMRVRGFRVDNATRQLLWEKNCDICPTRQDILNSMQKKTYKGEIFCRYCDTQMELRKERAQKSSVDSGLST